jgi:hypothetical protein
MPPEAAVAKISSRLRTGKLRGSVGPQSLLLRLNGEFVHRPYQPIFRGVVASAGDGTRLHGTVRTPLGLKIFVLSWLGFALFWSGGAYLATRGEAPERWMPFVGLGMFVLGVVFFRFVNRFVARLADTLELTIEEALAPVA